MNVVVSEPSDTAAVQSIMRDLATVWVDFEGQLETVPIIQKLSRGKLRLADYRKLLVNLRQQVVDGSCWIARAASNVDENYFDLRSRFLQHSVTEHRDYKMLEDNFTSVGGDLNDIQSTEKNIGSEALSAWMFHRASMKNPFDLLGAMFIIEGLGSRKAKEWGEAIQDQLSLEDEQVSFLLYHGANDEDHIREFEESVARVAHEPGVGRSIVKTAKVTGRLYALQLEELDHV